MAQPSLTDYMGRNRRGLPTPLGTPTFQQQRTPRVAPLGVPKISQFQQETPDNRPVVAQSPSGFKQISPQKVPKKGSLEEQLSRQMSATTQLAEPETFDDTRLAGLAQQAKRTGTPLPVSEPGMLSKIGIYETSPSAYVKSAQETFRPYASLAKAATQIGQGETPEKREARFYAKGLQSGATLGYSEPDFGDDPPRTKEEMRAFQAGAEAGSSVTTAPIALATGVGGRAALGALGVKGGVLPSLATGMGGKAALATAQGVGEAVVGGGVLGAIQKPEEGKSRLEMAKQAAFDPANIILGAAGEVVLGGGLKRAKPAIAAETPPIQQAAPAVAAEVHPPVAKPEQAGPSRFGTFEPARPEPPTLARPVAPQRQAAPVASRVTPDIQQQPSPRQLYERARDEAMRGTEKAAMQQADRGIIRQQEGMVAPEPTSLREAVLSRAQDELLKSLPKNQHESYRFIDKAVRDGLMTPKEGATVFSTIQKLPDALLGKTLFRRADPILKTGDIKSAIRYIKEASVEDPAMRKQLMRAANISEGTVDGKTRYTSWAGLSKMSGEGGLNDLAVINYAKNVPGLAYDTIIHEIGHLLAGTLPPNIRVRVTKRLSKYARSAEFENAVRDAGYPDADALIQEARTKPDEALAIIYTLAKKSEAGDIPRISTPLDPFIPRMESKNAVVRNRGMVAPKRGGVAADDAVEIIDDTFVIPMEQMAKFREQNRIFETRFPMGEEQATPPKKQDAGFALSEEQQKLMRKQPKRVYGQESSAQEKEYMDSGFVVSGKQKQMLGGEERFASPPADRPPQASSGARGFGSIEDQRFLDETFGERLADEITTPDERFITPDRPVYHATTDIRSVGKEGKLRAFDPSESRGVGGEAINGAAVSTTTNRAVAEMYAMAMKDLVDLAKATTLKNGAELRGPAILPGLKNLVRKYNNDNLSYWYSQIEQQVNNTPNPHWINFDSVRREFIEVLADSGRYGVRRDGDVFRPILIDVSRERFAKLNKNNIGVVESTEELAAKPGMFKREPEGEYTWQDEISTRSDVPLSKIPQKELQRLSKRDARFQPIDEQQYRPPQASFGARGFGSIDEPIEAAQTPQQKMKAEPTAPPRDAEKRWESAVEEKTLRQLPEKQQQTDAYVFEELFGTPPPAERVTDTGEIIRKLPGETPDDMKFRAEGGKVFGEDGAWEGGVYRGAAKDKAEAIEAIKKNENPLLDVKESDVVATGSRGESVVKTEKAADLVVGAVEEFLDNANAQRALDLTLRDGKQHVMGHAFEQVEAMIKTTKGNGNTYVESPDYLLGRTIKEVEDEFGYQPRIGYRVENARKNRFQQWIEKKSAPLKNLLRPLSDGLSSFTTKFKQATDITEVGGRLMSRGVLSEKRVYDKIVAASSKRVQAIAKKHGIGEAELYRKYGPGTENGKVIIRALDGWESEKIRAERVDNADAQKALLDEVDRTQKRDQELLRNDPVMQSLFLLNRRARDAKVLTLNIVSPDKARWVGFVNEYYNRTSDTSLDDFIREMGWEKKFDLAQSPEELALIRERFVNDPTVKKRLGMATVTNNGDWVGDIQRQAKVIAKWVADPYFVAAQKYGVENLPAYAQKDWGRLLAKAAGKTPITLGKYVGDVTRAGFSNLIPMFSRDGFFTYTGTIFNGGGFFKTTGNFLKNLANVKATGGELIRYAVEMGTPAMKKKMAAKLGIKESDLKGFDPLGNFMPGDMSPSAISRLDGADKGVAKGLETTAAVLRLAGMAWKFPGAYMAAAAQRTAKTVFESLGSRMGLAGDALDDFVRINLSKANTSDMSVNFAPIETGNLGRTMTQFASPSQKQFYQVIEKVRRGVNMTRLAKNLEADAQVFLKEGKAEEAKKLLAHAEKLRGGVKVTAKDFATYTVATMVILEAVRRLGIQEDAEWYDVVPGNLGTPYRRNIENLKKYDRGEMTKDELLLATISDVARGLVESHGGPEVQLIANGLGYKTMAQETYYPKAKGKDLMQRTLWQLFPPVQAYRNFVSRNPLVSEKTKQMSEEAILGSDLPEQLKEVLKPRMKAEQREMISASYDVTEDIAARNKIEKEKVSKSIRSASDEYGTPPESARDYGAWRDRVARSVARDLGLKTRDTGAGVVFIDPMDAYSVGYAINLERLRKLSHGRTDPYAASWGVISNASQNFSNPDTMSQILLEHYNSLQDERGRADFIQKMNDSLLLVPSKVTLRGAGDMKKKEIGKVYTNLIKGMKKDSIAPGIPSRDLAPMKNLL